MAERLQEMDALKSLQRNGAKVKGMTIETSKPVGLHLLTAIDCLVHHHKYSWVRKEPKHKSQEDNG